MVLWLLRRMLGRGSLAVVFEYDFGKGCADVLIERSLGSIKSRFNFDIVSE